MYVRIRVCTPNLGYVLSSCVNARRTHPFYPFKLMKYKTSATTFRCTSYLHHRIFGEPTFSRTAYSSAAVGTCTSPYVVSHVWLPYVFSTQQKGTKIISLLVVCIFQQICRKLLLRLSAMEFCLHNVIIAFSKHVRSPEVRIPLLL